MYTQFLLCPPPCCVPIQNCQIHVLVCVRTSQNARIYYIDVYTMFQNKTCFFLRAKFQILQHMFSNLVFLSCESRIAEACIYLEINLNQNCKKIFCKSTTINCYNWKINHSEIKINYKKQKETTLEKCVIPRR